jgi:hypothetical protein
VIGILSTALGALGCWVWGSKLVLLHRINRDWRALQEDGEPAVLENQEWLIEYLRDQKTRCKEPGELAKLEAWLKREETWLSDHRNEKSQATSRRLQWSRTQAGPILLYLGVSVVLLVIGTAVCILTFW